ncbi:C40 family peptidase [Streptomyces ureilyticus]|uniref:Glycoside hydrolase n=1 Tax=Streptomyces ureilyticus TaxID=1775131 RepID=A0ABX0E1T9_9ACTN|nr:C40 family peptidase [Streptomyces ureilyticus]NGO47400.1 glycoside hydrolase [Streptomyces ureilyticus]
MAPHRKARSSSPKGIRTPALATAALTSVALLSQTANASPSAEPKPSLDEVQKKVDDLYAQAETATEKYNGAKEKTSKQRKKADNLLDDVASRTQKLNEAREELGTFAAEQYRTGAAAPDAAAMLLADSPQDYFDQNQLMDRLTSRQQQAVDDYATQQSEMTQKRQEASESLQALTKTENTLKSSKADVQRKLAEARQLLSRLTTEEKARLAAIEQEKRQEAQRKAEELARQQQAAEEQRRQQQQAQPTPAPSTGAGTSTGTGTSAGASTAKGEKALAFARSQTGKPYVWGASGPDSYDCSGLTQAAWKAAGVTLPRTTWDQVKTGTQVSVASAQPGDLVFFYDDISHVGLYLGDGMMIHAPKPGAYVREESIYYMPVHSVVRPA